LSGLQVQQADQLAEAEDRLRRANVFGEEGDRDVQGPDTASKLPAGMDYPGTIRLKGAAENYTIGGMGLLRAEPYLKRGSGFYVRNSWQKSGCWDSLYVRLVGPSIVRARCSVVRSSDLSGAPDRDKQDYVCSYSLREPGIYTIQAWVEYRDLPASVVSDANPKGHHPNPVVANSYTFPRADLLLYTGLVDGRYAEGSAAAAGIFARDVDSGWTSTAEAHGPRSCATGMRRGRWVARQYSGCPAGAFRLLREAWEWRPHGCRLHEFCGAEAARCILRHRTVAVAGDSIARELFDEVGSVMLQRDVSWREIFPHKHASGSRELNGTMIKMMWIPDPLATITEQLRGPIQLREQYTKADVLIISAGYWYLYRTSAKAYLDGVRNLTRVAAEALDPRTKVVWVAVPAGWMNFGYRIRPRIQAWNEGAARIVSEAGWHVLDAFHLSDARPEKTDGTHIGNDTDRENMQGAPTLSKSVANMLLGMLCGDDDNALGGARGGFGAPGGPQADSDPLPMEWPNWPESRRYASRESLMESKSLGQHGAAKGAEAVRKPPPSRRAARPAKPNTVTLGDRIFLLGRSSASEGKPHHRQDSLRQRPH